MLAARSTRADASFCVSMLIESKRLKSSIGIPTSASASSCEGIVTLKTKYVRPLQSRVSNELPVISASQKLPASGLPLIEPVLESDISIT